MSQALPLSPVDVNYLTSRNRFEQLTVNTADIELNTNNFTASVTPKVQTKGDGTVYLTGSAIVAGTPAANYVIGTLPSWCVPAQDDLFPVQLLRSGAAVSNALKVNTGGDSVESITVTAPGSYATLPTVSITAPGAGAMLGLNMQLVSATAAAAGTGYVPGEKVTLAGGTSSIAARVAVQKTKVISAAVNAAGTGYVPGNVLTAVGGTGTAATFTVATTKVVSATIAAAGSGGSDGTQTVTGTTGTGTKFTASVTVSGGAITAILSITGGGSYTVNPTSLTAEPVTGASLTGAQLSIVMGVNTITLATAGSYTANSATFTTTGGTGTGATLNTVVYGVSTVAVDTAGSYSALPSSPVSQASTSGSGTGATFTALWGVLSVPVTAPGAGYSSLSQVVFSGGGGTGGAAATLNFDTGVNLQLVNAPTVGDILFFGSASFIVDAYSSQ